MTIDDGLPPLERLLRDPRPETHQAFAAELMAVALRGRR
jgi:hypothetical protein